MKTIRIFLYTAAFLAAATSCKQTPDTSVKEMPEGHGTLTLNLVPAGIATKATLDPTDDEALISDVLLVAMDETGNLDTYYTKTAENISSVQVSLRPGNKELFVFANVGDNFESADVIDKDAMTTLALSFGNHVERDYMPMYFGWDDPLTPTVEVGEDVTETVTLKHYCSRLVVKSITNLLPYALGEATYLSVAMVNYPACVYANGEAMNETRLDAVGGTYTTADQSFEGDVTFQTLDPDEEGVFDPVSLYCYPGVNTLLQLAVDIDGTPNYYLIPLPELEPNTSYDVNLTLLNKGSEDPTNPQISTHSQITLDIEPWTVGDTIEELL